MFSSISIPTSQTINVASSSGAGDISKTNEKIIINVAGNTLTTDLLPLPKSIKKVGKIKYKVPNSGVMTSDQIFDQCEAISREKERVQKQKDENKIIREEKRLIRDNIKKIKQEKDVNLPKRGRGRPRKIPSMNED